MDDGGLNWDSILACLSSLSNVLTTPKPVRMQMQFIVMVRYPSLTLVAFFLCRFIQDIPQFLSQFDQVRWLDRDTVDGFDDVWLSCSMVKITLLILRRIARELPA